MIKLILMGYYYSIIKRLIDLSFSLIAILALWPVFIIICIVIRIDSKGPCLFKQIRISKDRKPFSMYKFRTMIENADSLKKGLKDKNEVDGPVFKIRNDPRLTRIGKFLRERNLDELPQLFNVLKGDMSLIGPRPALLEEIDNYKKDWYHNRFKVKPGMASLFHIKNKKGMHYNFEEWMKWDNYYIDNKSLWLDIAIIAKSTKSFLKRILFL